VVIVVFLIVGYRDELRYGREGQFEDATARPTPHA
jgi:hypothetical protein